MGLRPVEGEEQCGVNVLFLYEFEVILSALCIKMYIKTCKRVFGIVVGMPELSGDMGMKIVLPLLPLWLNRKEGNVLFNDEFNTYYLRLYGVRHMVKDHSDSERGNLLPPHGLLFPISSKGYLYTSHSPKCI